MTRKHVSSLQKAVLVWYSLHGRHTLPWRKWDATNLAYRVLVSEFMLQQTQVERVIPKFKAFLAYFPTIQTLASATSAKTVVLWSGLGYNRRAALLHATARAIVKTHHATVPSDIALLNKLPGIGDTTAAAIAAFAYNLPAVVWDTNIQRFFELLIWGYHTPPASEARRIATELIPRGQSRAWHSALMDLMSAIRSEKSPKKQQAKLLILLDLDPGWGLPLLAASPFRRPKQSKFVGSKRYYRALIIEFLRLRKNHSAPFSVINKALWDRGMPEDYSLVDLVQGLKKDTLVTYRGEPESTTQIRL